MHRRQFLGRTVAAIAATVIPLEPLSGALAAEAPANHIVRISGFEFSPSILRVKPGDRVTFINMDIVPHTATSSNGSWDTGHLGPNQRKDIVITKGSGNDYLCLFHPSMKARLTLTPK